MPPLIGGERGGQGKSRKIPEEVRALGAGVRPETQETEKGHSGWAFDGATIGALLEFAEEEEKVSVRLVKKRGEEE